MRPNSKPKFLYFYHPDYLGSVEFITDMRGDPYQFFLNTPFGENLENQMAYHYKGFSSRFRFNGKEWDDRAFKKCPVDIFSEGASLPRGQGNYYYGARYYDPKVSVWLSVDPLASKSPGQTPYHFVSNNPIMRIDPNGLTDYLLDKETGNTTKVDGTEGNEGPDRVVADRLAIYDWETGELLNDQDNVLEVEKGIMGNKRTNKINFRRDFGARTVGSSGLIDIYEGFSSEENALQFFEFMANNSDVEFSFVLGNGIREGIHDRMWVTTTHDAEISAGISHFYNNSPLHDVQKGYFSHPLGGQPQQIDADGLRGLKRYGKHGSFKVYFPMTQSYSREFNAFTKF